MAVYNVNGLKVNSVYNIFEDKLSHVYDILGNDLLQNERLIINEDESTGIDSGYALTSRFTGNTYVLRQIADWGTTGFQSVIANSIGNSFYRMSETSSVTVFDSTMSIVNMVTLQDVGGHKNDATYIDGKMYMLDGTANDPKSMYVWDVSGTSVSKVNLPISDNENGSLRVVAGITKYYGDNYLYLVSRDKFGDSDIDHQTGDAMNVYRYNISKNIVEFVASYDWDCVYIQGAACYNGILYVICNSQTTGSASNYTGVTVKCIRMDRWHLFDELTVEGAFEPEGMDVVDFSAENTELTMGLGKWNSVSKFLRFTPPYGLTYPTVALFGDSISTFAGYIYDDNVAFYNGNNFGVSSVDETWWKRIANNSNMNILINNSNTGRAVSNVRDVEAEHSSDAGYKEHNTDILGTNGTPHIIMVLLGTNDYTHDCTLTVFEEAYETMLTHIKNKFPSSVIYCLTPLACIRNGGQRKNHNNDGVEDFGNVIKELAGDRDCQIIDIYECGITYENISRYMGDYSSATGDGTHPNSDGMALMAEYVNARIV